MPLSAVSAEAADRVPAHPDPCLPPAIFADNSAAHIPRPRWAWMWAALHVDAEQRLICRYEPAGMHSVAR